MGYGLWFVVWFFGVVLHRKIRLTQLWVELSWVVATILVIIANTFPAKTDVNNLMVHTKFLPRNLLAGNNYA